MIKNAEVKEQIIDIDKKKEKKDERTYRICKDWD